MKTLNEVNQILLNQIQATEIETIGLLESHGRILAEHVYSDTPIPPFNKSAMDGYACRKEDLKDLLEVIDCIPAGKASEKTITKGTCAKIMTGAKIPKGADCVVMVEDTIFEKNKIMITKNVSKTNICLQGEDVKEGDLILKKGCKLKSQHTAVLAAAGKIQVKVYKQPKVSILASGSELLEPNKLPENGMIRNSNSYQLMAQLKKTSAQTAYYGITSDDYQSLNSKINTLSNLSDVLILTGGVSVGDYDLIPQILEDINFEILVNKIAMKPGKPMIIAKRNNTFCFALSGNPVSSFFQFELIVQQAIENISGNKSNIKEIKLPIAETIKRKKTDRQQFFPITINNNGEAVPLVFNGSAHIHSLINATGITSFAQGEEEIKKGDKVNVRQIQ